MISYRPLSTYKHDGQIMHPKLSYALPPGMGKAMVNLALFEVVSVAPDVDLSGMIWDDKTERADYLAPESIVLEQNTP